MDHDETAIKQAIANATAVAKQAADIDNAATVAAQLRAQAVARIVELLGGNQSAAARLLNMDQSTVSKLVGKHRTRAAGNAAASFTEALRELTQTVGGIRDALDALAESLATDGPHADFDEPPALVGRIPEPEPRPQ